MAETAEYTTTISDDNLAVIHKLNNDHATELSYLTNESMTELLRTSFLALIATLPVENARVPCALLVAFSNSNSSYTSPNFLWFKERYDKFIYVDRVVVDEKARGKGIAKKMYEILFQKALVEGHTVIGCEVNIDPPNPVSDIFHDKQGFKTVGEKRLEERGKSVRYLIKSLDGSH